MKGNGKTKKLTRWTATLLCAALLCASFSASATAESSASAPSEEPFVSFEDELPEELRPLLLEEETAPMAEETAVPLPEASTEPTEAPTAAPSEEPTPEPTATPSPTPTPIPTVKVTFRMESFGNRELQVTAGEALGAEQVPEIPELPKAAFQGWYNAKGEPVDPAAEAPQTDTVYYARWTRVLSELLETERHVAYVRGSDHLFRPNGRLTRAEAAQMLYGLLQDQEGPEATFPDVKANQWFAPAVDTLAGLGIITGKENGKFEPNASITRAEFVTLATRCDSLSEEPITERFTDVPVSSWAAPYVASAAAKGWVEGKEDGKFHPNDPITRAEAVTVINRMLGRVPDVRVKNFQGMPEFYDLETTHWAYGQIMEAAAGHTYLHAEGGGETWKTYDREAEPLTENKWLKIDGKTYCVSKATKKFCKGLVTLDGQQYVFDKTTGAAYTGFYYVDGYFWYVLNGVFQKKDISGLGVVKGPYSVKVYKNSNYLVVFAADDKGNFNKPVKAMRCSCGNATPTGVFYTPQKYRWLQMVGDTWAQWCTQIYGNFLFHSVPNWTHSAFDLEVEEYNHLGETRSLGCVRLNCRDAKWMYDNCSLGMRVEITTKESTGPLPKPAGITIPYWHSWDPTDPTANWKCKEAGCSH